MTHWANTKKAYPNIIPCRIRREKSRRKKPFVRKFVLVFIFFCCASESVNEQLGLPVKKRMRSKGMKCAGKTLSFVRLMSLMQWLSFFPSNLSGRKSNITVKKDSHHLMAWPFVEFRVLNCIKCTVAPKTSFFRVLRGTPGYLLMFRICVSSHLIIEYSSCKSTF